MTGVGTYQQVASASQSLILSRFVANDIGLSPSAAVTMIMRLMQRDHGASQVNHWNSAAMRMIHHPVIPIAAPHGEIRDIQKKMTREQKVILAYDTGFFTFTPLTSNPILQLLIRPTSYVLPEITLNPLTNRQISVRRP